MKKKELEELEKINKERKLSSEIKEKIGKKALNNFLMSLDILLLFIILMITGRNLNKETTVAIYKISSVVLFMFALIIIEVAYKKDNDEIALNSIEILALSVVTLLTPYIFIERINVTGTIVGCYFTAYYILKNLVIYRKEKNKYLRQQSDISQIVKKESQDVLAQEEINKISNAEPPKRKRGRPRKTATP